MAEVFRVVSYERPKSGLPGKEVITFVCSDTIEQAGAHVAAKKDHEIMSVTIHLKKVERA